ncbi:MAG TPA: alpha/beta fold hydrolase [Methyloceanibacter sp.]|nr:alpha/beta fold hydrolase [Methyloceanibacter sp.]
MLRARLLSGLAAFGAFAVFLGLGGDRAEALYDVPAAEIRGKPGTLIRVWPLLSGGPGNSDAFRFLYRSTGLKGEIIPVSGAIFIPSGPAPAGGRNVIAWAHPTSGVAPDCAPSLYPDRAGLIWNLRDMLSEGYVVVATDYPGLGTDGIHPYLIGESAGRAVLDSVRAARNFNNSKASNRFAVWGHSEGGHASLFTGQLAARYAPDLKLVGVAAAAPATYLVDLFKDDATTEQDLIAMALLSWSKLRNVAPATIIEPSKIPAFEKTARDCLTSIAQFQTLEKDQKPLHGKLFKSDPTKTEPWKGIMLRNSPGNARAGAPVFIAQGTADTTVNPQVTKRFAKSLCAKGERVTFVSLPGVSHIFAARDSAPTAIKWMNDRFKGLPAPSSCQR